MQYTWGQDGESRTTFTYEKGEGLAIFIRGEWCRVQSIILACTAYLLSYVHWHCSGESEMGLFSICSPCFRFLPAVGSYPKDRTTNFLQVSYYHP